MVIVLPPRRGSSPWRALKSRARSIASQSTPRCSKKRASSAAMTARWSDGAMRSSETQSFVTPYAPAFRTMSGVSGGGTMRKSTTQARNAARTTPAARPIHRTTCSTYRRPCHLASRRCSSANMADTRTTPHGLAFAPTKVGVLIDMDMGTKADFLACLRMTFDEAVADGTILRPVELVVKEAIGLPRLEAKNTIDGYL